ncbi:hypothetical protein SUDANB21_05310 [Streptomyces sp. enrichment culture]|uniref:hypothetical protein n=1 Tax=Streptomyces sp. MD20-1-1 TaxID=3028668 RepID=UPI0029B9F1EA|nr:hypothetical protein [Streptomyces sp. MD20-1-1]WTC15959.1 hypothetical protein OH709_08700 [Streptomyces cellulosae]
MQARIIEASREMVGSSLMYNPEGMMQIGEDFANLPEVFQNLAKSLYEMTRQVQEGDTPMDPAIVDMVRTVHAEILKVAQSAEDLRPMFENLHADDIKRIRQPRRNEHYWDVANNRDYLGRG